MTHPPRLSGSDSGYGDALGSGCRGKQWYGHFCFPFGFLPFFLASDSVSLEYVNVFGGELTQVALV